MGKLSLITATLLLAACRSTLGYWDNDFDRRLDFVCLSGADYIKRIKSMHSNHYEDRRFEIECKETTYRPDTCRWSVSWAAYDGAWTYRCPYQYYLSGISSVHDSKKEDRKWKFYCCRYSKPHAPRCEWTYWLNRFDNDFDYTVDSKYLIHSISSEHDNRKEDIIYKKVERGLALKPSIGEHQTRHQQSQMEHHSKQLVAYDRSTKQRSNDGSRLIQTLLIRTWLIRTSLLADSDLMFLLHLNYIMFWGSEI